MEFERNNDVISLAIKEKFMITHNRKLNKDFIYCPFPNYHSTFDFFGRSQIYKGEKQGGL